MKTKGQRNLKLLGGQEKTDGQPDGQADSSIYFVVRGYKKATQYRQAHGEDIINSSLILIEVKQKRLVNTCYHSNMHRHLS
jgi:hypothetical protein